jgi:hypothetical protein
MKILAFGKDTPKGSADAYAKHGRSEALKVWELQQVEFIRESWFRRAENSAVLVLEAEDMDDAEKRLRELPFVRLGLIEFDLVPLRPYPGLGRFFGKEETI